MRGGELRFPKARVDADFGGAADASECVEDAPEEKHLTEPHVQKCGVGQVDGMGGQVSGQPADASEDGGCAHAERAEHCSAGRQASGDLAEASCQARHPGQGASRPLALSAPADGVTPSGRKSAIFETAPPGLAPAGDAAAGGTRRARAASLSEACISVKKDSSAVGSHAASDNFELDGKHDAAAGDEFGGSDSEPAIRPGLEWIAWMGQIEAEAFEQGAAAAARKAARPMGLQYPRKLKAVPRGAGRGFETTAAVLTVDGEEFFCVTGFGDTPAMATLQAHQQLLFMLYTTLGESIDMHTVGGEPPRERVEKYVRRRAMALMDVAVLPPDAREEALHAAVGPLFT